MMKDDNGPKKFVLVDEVNKKTIVGTYHLSNLLQELAQLKEAQIILKSIESHSQENPVHRISRKIRDDYWEELTFIDKKRVDTNC
jgi:alpha,alpha-trehalase